MSEKEERKREARSRILVVDDEPGIRDSLRMILEFEGYAVQEARHGAEAVALASERPPEAVLLDLRMPEMDGMATLRALRERGIEAPVLMISGHGDLHTAVEAARQGAYDFFEKPLQRDRILLSLRNALETRRLRRENQSLRREPDELIGGSPAMKRLRETIERAAPTPATVLVLGESGTGKELVARAIHRLGSRSQGPLVQVNCAAIPDELIESELFGHEKGSFTGAVRRQVGKFVAADGGTIFLDEIGDMSPRTQAKVLRVLENGEVEPVGGERGVRVDVRVIAATHRDLEKEIAAGRFREDLYYRLNVVVVRTPALRERAEDVPELVSHFVRLFSESANYRRREFSPRALDLLRAQPWRGNVRELRNLVERVLILAAGERIEPQDLVDLGVGGSGSGLPDALLAIGSLRDFRDAAERLYLLRKLEENGWNVTQTAQAIDTPRSNLYKKMEAYGIRRQGAGADGAAASGSGSDEEAVDERD